MNALGCKNVAFLHVWSPITENSYDANFMLVELVIDVEWWWSGENSWFKLDVNAFIMVVSSLMIFDCYWGYWRLKRIAQIFRDNAKWRQLNFCLFYKKLSSRLSLLSCSLTLALFFLLDRTISLWVTKINRHKRTRNWVTYEMKRRSKWKRFYRCSKECDIEIVSFARCLETKMKIFAQTSFLRNSLTKKKTKNSNVKNVYYEKLVKHLLQYKI